MNNVPHRPDPSETPTRILAVKRAVGGLAPPEAAPHQRPPAAGTTEQGVSVNSFSRAINPRIQYPLHFDFMMRDLYNRGLIPEEWQVVAADEVRLDEMGMTIEFTVVHTEMNVIDRLRVEIEGGKLVKVSR